MDLSFSDLGNRAVLWLVTAVAVLSFVTGILNIGMTAVSGPLSGYLPLGVQQAAGFTGALTGVLMLMADLGLRKRLRKAWILMMVLLPLTALQGFIQSSIVSLPLIVLSLISIPVLFARRDFFDQKSSLSPVQMAALTAFIGVQIYGTAGAYALREGFTNDLTLLDALYFSVVTSSTVGYGDLLPVSPEARLFVLTLVIFGTASFAGAVGALLSPFIESKLASKFEDLESEIVEDIEEDIRKEYSK